MSLCLAWVGFCLGFLAVYRSGQSLQNRTSLTNGMFVKLDVMVEFVERKSLQNILMQCRLEKMLPDRNVSWIWITWESPIDGQTCWGTFVVHNIQHEDLEDWGTCSFYYRSILNAGVMFFASLVSIVAVHNAGSARSIYCVYIYIYICYTYTSTKPVSQGWKYNMTHFCSSKRTFLGFSDLPEKKLWILKKLWSYELIVKLVYPEISLGEGHTSPEKLQRKVTVKLRNDDDLPWNSHEFTLFCCEFSFSRWNQIYDLISICPVFRVFGGSSYESVSLSQRLWHFCSDFSRHRKVLLLSQWLPTRTMAQVLGIVSKLIRVNSFSNFFESQQKSLTRCFVRETSGSSQLLGQIYLRIRDWFSTKN